MGLACLKLLSIQLFIYLATLLQQESAGVTLAFSFFMKEKPDHLDFSLFRMASVVVITILLNASLLKGVGLPGALAL